MKHPAIAYLAVPIFTLVLISACRLYYKPQKVAYGITGSGAEDLKEGKRLTLLTCAPCHYNPETKKLTGIRMQDVPGILGKIYSTNITQHPEKGIGTYTDAELAYLIRTGIARTGKLMPFMQRPNMADEDLRAIIAFLRSSDELVTPSEADAGKTRYSPVGKFAISMSPSLPYPAKEINKPAVSDKTAYGKYLVDNLSCYDCHSASFAAIDKMEPEKSKGYMGGGNKLKNNSSEKVLSPNITFHETGIGSWTEHDLRKALKEGISKNNSIIAFPMPMYPDLNDEEIAAIYAYLKSIPKINNKVARR